MIMNNINFKYLIKHFCPFKEPLQSICLWFDQIQLANQMGKNFTQFEFERKKICKPITAD
jgi:hypothetical protein